MQEYEVVERNLRRSLECYARATRQGEIKKFPGVLIASAGVDSAVFNAAMLSGPVKAEPVELDRRIMVAKVFFSARQLNWSFWVCNDMVDPSLLGKVRRVFAARGLHQSSNCPGMLAEAVAPISRELPPLECRRVRDADTRLSFCHLTSMVFRVPFETTLTIYNSERAWETDLIAYVGYIDNQPVATAATVTTDGAVGVYSVATLPEFRKRGVAERITRHALDRAREMTGIERSVLQSSRQGHA
ncbi:MAG: GNAT family N-acetyltransferase, partial [bacterium]|nr:GNAT family N-acetyltransferase [bacterium]